MQHPSKARQRVTRNRRSIPGVRVTHLNRSEAASSAYKELLLPTSELSANSPINLFVNLAASRGRSVLAVEPAAALELFEFKRM